MEMIKRVYHPSISVFAKSQVKEVPEFKEIYVVGEAPTSERRGNFSFTADQHRTTPTTFIGRTFSSTEHTYERTDLVIGYQKQYHVRYEVVDLNNSSYTRNLDMVSSSRGISSLTEEHLVEENRMNMMLSRGSRLSRTISVAR
ncbi:hypothetical protein C5167_008801 [Papaver somniferum]|uniref:Uncharacterized protein n=1 Tax=Papaver somniferum TaxID=3469 RepID=A0A4Y7JVJ3_PAPSO|nr:hypothetical protein C5167_008801 [Papaver somniferum]